MGARRNFSPARPAPNGMAKSVPNCITTAVATATRQNTTMMGMRIQSLKPTAIGNSDCDATIAAYTLTSTIFATTAAIASQSADCCMMAQLFASTGMRLPSDGMGERFSDGGGAVQNLNRQKLHHVAAGLGFFSVAGVSSAGGGVSSNAIRSHLAPRSGIWTATPAVRPASASGCRRRRGRRAQFEPVPALGVEAAAAARACRP